MHTQRTFWARKMFAKRERERKDSLKNVRSCAIDCFELSFVVVVVVVD